MDETRPLLDPQALRALLRQLESSQVDEFEYVQGNRRLYLRRQPGAPALPPAAEVVAAAAPDLSGVPVVAPLTGVLYIRPSPNEPPFVTPGARVEAGQTVALIETMKLFNEVVTNVAGEVLSLAAEEGALVEAGQPLLYIRPGEESEDV